MPRSAMVGRIHRLERERRPHPRDEALDPRAFAIAQRVTADRTTEDDTRDLAAWIKAHADAEGVPFTANQEGLARFDRWLREDPSGMAIVHRLSPALERAMHA